MDKDEQRLIDKVVTAADKTRRHLAYESNMIGKLIEYSAALELLLLECKEILELYVPQPENAKNQTMLWMLRRKGKDVLDEMDHILNIRDEKQ